MHRAIHYSMFVLMLVWTAAVAADIAVSLLGDTTVTGAVDTASPVASAENVLLALRTDIWGATAQARAIVWGIPMTVFALVAAITQR